ncbi:MAG TPA: hypothetical protein VEJ87_08255 [Acidimicrobiales bacterium]|nr:hypothetical protein [Acidimicrobiales bacterium]
MGDPIYPACTRELYESEILGETLFLTLVAEAKNPRERYHLATLLQLESETKARLRPLLFKHGVSLDESADLSLIDVAVGAYRDMLWPDFMAANLGPVQGFLTRFEEIAAIGDPDDKDILQSMIRHEAAILRWATKESKGEVDGSLDDIIVQLNYPLPVKQ